MTRDEGCTAIVLAAGQGTRMKSALPKVLHELCGRPMVAWSIGAALEAGVSRAVVVVGHGREHVEAVVRTRFGDAVELAHQAEQRGTGHAVRCALEGRTLAGTVVIVYGDCPMLRASTLRALIDARAHSGALLSMLVSELADPTGYGRIIRDASGHAVAIREHKDCSAAERDIREVNPGMYAVDATFLREAISSLTTDNAQGELYLTDVVALAAQRSTVVTVHGDMDELSGINDRRQLADAEALLRRRILDAHALAGVTIRNMSTTSIDADVTIEPDVTLEGQVTLRGNTRVGAGSRIDVGCVLTDVAVAPGAHLKPYSVAQASTIGENCQIGPFAHLRPESELAADVHVGNFVETKKTRMGRGSKANHLAYLGDGEVGERVNVGAGTIFCNYDGFQKHVTVLEDDVFIGSDSQLVAPIRVGKGAYVGTGTTVTKNVPDGALAIGRAKQENKEGYAARLRARLRAAKEAVVAKKDS